MASTSIDIMTDAAAYQEFQLNTLRAMVACYDVAPVVEPDRTQNVLLRNIAELRMQNQKNVDIIQALVEVITNETPPFKAEVPDLIDFGPASAVAEADLIDLSAD